VRSTGDALLDACRQEVLDKVENMPIPFGPLRFPQRGPELLSGWGDVRDEMDELEEQFMSGEMTWQEYEDRLREVGNG
jgi:hypothetical protein